MLMQSTECGENLVSDLCIDFSQTLQDWSPAVAEEDKVFIHASIILW